MDGNSVKLSRLCLNTELGMGYKKGLTVQLYHVIYSFSPLIFVQLRQEENEWLRKVMRIMEPQRKKARGQRNQGTPICLMSSLEYFYTAAWHSHNIVTVLLQKAENV